MTDDELHTVLNAMLHLRREIERVRQILESLAASPLFHGAGRPPETHTGESNDGCD